MRKILLFQSVCFRNVRFSSANLFRFLAKTMILMLFVCCFFFRPFASAVSQINDSASGSKSRIAETPTLNKSDNTFLPEIRRFFFPEDDVTVIPRDGRSLYININAELFWQEMNALRQFHSDNRDIKNQSVLKSLRLYARLEENRILSGQGMLQINAKNSTGTVNAIPYQINLSPFQLAVTNSVWEKDDAQNDTMPEHTEQINAAQLGLDSNGEIVLNVPVNAKTLHFDWTLQEQSGLQNDMLFLLTLPRFPDMRLTLDLPADKKPVVPSGIVQLDQDENSKAANGEGQNLPQNYRRWLIFFNINKPFQVMITADENNVKYHHQVGISSRQSYDLSIYGMQLNTLFFLERSFYRLEYVTLEIDKPLYPLSVKLGDRVLSWSEIQSDNDTITQLLVSIPQTETNIRELQIQSFCPIHTGQLWELPKVRLVSPLFFWSETRNIVRVNHPLLTRRIDVPEQRQDMPSSNATDIPESDLFVFQAFSENAKTSIELGLHSSSISSQSGTSFSWGEREILARSVVDVTVETGRLQQLELDVAANWTVDMITLAKSSNAAQIMNYDLEDVADDQKKETSSQDARWAIQFRKTLESSQTIRLIVQLRRPVTTLQNAVPVIEKLFKNHEEFTARIDPRQKSYHIQKDFIPFHVVDAREGTRLVAFDTLRKYRWITPDSNTFQSPTVSRDRVNERFDELPFGTVFVIDESAANIFLETEPLQPAYEMSAITNLSLRNGYLVETCRFYCVPTDNSRIERLYVNFSPEDKTKTKTNFFAADNGLLSTSTSSWNWKLEQSTETPQIKAVLTDNPPFSSLISGGECWEITLTPSRSLPFEMTATRILPFEDSTKIPLPFFPEITTSEALFHIETKDAILYRILKNHAKNISGLPIVPNNETSDMFFADDFFERFLIASSEDDCFLRGTYRYSAAVADSGQDGLLILEPQKESVLISQNTAHMSEKRDAESVLLKGIVWNMTLHTHYNEDGEIVSYAVIELENRLLRQLKIMLPRGMTHENIRNIWVDNEKGTWQSVVKQSGETDILVDVFPQQRYTIIVMDYLRQKENPTDYKTLSPDKLTLEIPVVAQKWFAWYPPQYYGYLQSTDSRKWTIGNFFNIFNNNSSQQSRGFARNDVPIISDPPQKFNLFMSKQIVRSYFSGSTQKRLAECADRLIHLLNDSGQLRQIHAELTADPTRSNVNIKSSAANIASKNSATQTLSLSADFPTWGELLTSAAFENHVSGNGIDNSLNHSIHPMNIFVDKNSLAYFHIYADETICHENRNKLPDRDFLEKNHLAVIFDANDNLLVTTTLLSAKLRHCLVSIRPNCFWHFPHGNIITFLQKQKETNNFFFVSANAWKIAVDDSHLKTPFLHSLTPPNVYHPGWAVREFNNNTDSCPTILLIRKSTLVAYQLLAFFIVVLTAWKIPLKQIAWLIVVLLLSVTAIMFFPLPYIGIAHGVFWGDLCVVAFLLLQNRKLFVVSPEPVIYDNTTVLSTKLFAEDSEVGEVRNLVSQESQHEMVREPESTEIDFSDDNQSAKEMTTNISDKKMNSPEK